MWCCATILVLAVTGDPAATRRSTIVDGAAEVAARIDGLCRQHWQVAGVQPAPTVSDAGFLRRLTLDLAGRVPTYREAVEFAQDPHSDKRVQAARRLLDGPEYSLHLANVLDEIIQGRHAGDGEFVEYLRQAVASRTPWDKVFVDILLGPWDVPQRKAAARFLSRRANNLDELTNDTASVFFGVNISCAKCHDHPLVDDWKQDHYYGLASFLSRTQELEDLPTPVGERDEGELTFVDTSGVQHAAKTMFLGGQTVVDPKLGLDPRLADRRQAAQEQKQYLPPAFSLREELVQVALAEQKFFSRAVANRVWANFMGRGLVHPVDQMHSQNPSSIPGLIEFLGEDLAAYGYNLDRLVAGIVTSGVYQLSGTGSSGAEPPSDEHFAVARLRSLTPQQFALSMQLAAGEEGYDQAADESSRRQRYLELAGRGQGWTPQLDRQGDSFQASVTEALFVSNHPQLQQLTQPAGSNLAARLADIAETDRLVETAVWTVLSRGPEVEERAELAQWLERPGIDRRAACGHLVWALLASAEFRFNH